MPASVTKEPIAVIGIACRFPGSNSIAEFWDNLVNGRDCVTAPPATRHHQLLAGRRGGFIDHVEAFDADFFGVNQSEAELIDPQQRHLLEVTWCALEDAGYNPTTLAGTNTCVVIGLAGTEYDHLVKDHDENPSVRSHLGVHSSITAGRLSQYFDLRGKSFTVNTACSSALIAIESACQELWLEQSELAIVGGVNLLFTPYISERLHNSGWLSVQGVSRSFDANADGYVRSEGVGVIVLKPYSQARTDNDRIYAVITDTCVRHNGRGNGLSLPSMQAQIDLLNQIYARPQAALRNQSLIYVETNSVGAPLADAVELKALGSVIGKQRPACLPLRIGCLKPNIGHCEAASGMAGFIKVAMSLYHRTLPPTIFFKSTIQELDISKMGLQVQTRLERISADIPAARAGVSSFGFSGANAHLLLQEMTRSIETPGSCCPLQMILFSARSPVALFNLANSVHQFLLKRNTEGFADLCFTINTKRHLFNHRLAVIAGSPAQLVDQLQMYLDCDHEGSPDQSGFVRYEIANSNAPMSRPVGFVFTGFCKLASQTFVYMRDNYDLFRQSTRNCEKFIRAKLGIDLAAALDPQSSPMLLTEELQGFLSEYLTLAIWKAWGVEPALCIGDGLGHLGAAVAAGLIDLHIAIEWLLEPYNAAPPQTRYQAQKPFFSAWTNTLVKTGGIADSSSWQLQASQRSQPPSNLSSVPELGSIVRIRLATGCLDEDSACTDSHLPSGLGIEQLMIGLARASKAGVNLNLNLVGGYKHCQVLSLPPYPFERQYFDISNSGMGRSN